MQIKIFYKPTTPEKDACFLEHLASLGLSGEKLSQTSPSILKQHLLEKNTSVAIVQSDLRFLIPIEKIEALQCDVALFFKDKKVDESFMFLKPTEKTKEFLKTWEKSNCLEKAIEGRALSMQIFLLPSLLKAEELKDEPLFHRWFLRI